MPYSVRYTRAASAEVEEAISWYAQPTIAKALAFVEDLERSDLRLRAWPELYQQVGSGVRRAVLSRFPYSLFYLLEPGTVVVLACMHHHQKPRSCDELVKD